MHPSSALVTTWSHSITSKRFSLLEDLKVLKFLKELLITRDIGCQCIYIFCSLSILQIFEVSLFLSQYTAMRASQVVLVVRNPAANTGAIRDAGLIPGSGRSSGRGHGSPLQYSCLENPMDRGAWRATAHGVRVRHS